MGQDALLHLKQKIRGEMDLAWRDFFEKNPGKKREDVLRWLEERLRSVQNSKDEDKEVYVLRRREKIAPLILKRRIGGNPYLKQAVTWCM